MVLYTPSPLLFLSSLSAVFLNMKHGACGRYYSFEWLSRFSWLLQGLDLHNILDNHLLQGHSSQYFVSPNWHGSEQLPGLAVGSSHLGNGGQITLPHPGHMEAGGSAV